MVSSDVSFDGRRMIGSKRELADLRYRIGQRTKKARLELTAETQAALAEYLALLQFWNRKINLTALAEPDELVDRLVVEPVAAVQRLPGGTVSLMDVGSGSGSPAIPLRICAPSIRLLMVESKTRKAAFLREAIRHLRLTNAEVEPRRFEELLARPDLNETVDIVCVRAVRVDVRVLFQLQSFVRPLGQIWLFTTARSSGEPLPPMLQLEADDPLLKSRGSRLRRLRKAPLD
jgi:16S rRNA (guanine527-N7)-methyltransferase